LYGHVSIVNLTMSGGRLTVARTIPDSWPRNPDRPARPSSRKAPRRRAAWFRPEYRGNSSRQPANGMSQGTTKVPFYAGIASRSPEHCQSALRLRSAFAHRRSGAEPGSGTRRCHHADSPFRAPA
jgi:hypothetical protein